MSIDLNVRHSLHECWIGRIEVLSWVSEGSNAKWRRSIGSRLLGLLVGRLTRNPWREDEIRQWLECTYWRNQDSHALRMFDWGEWRELLELSQFKRISTVGSVIELMGFLQEGDLLDDWICHCWLKRPVSIIKHSKKLLTFLQEPYQLYCQILRHWPLFFFFNHSRHSPQSLLYANMRSILLSWTLQFWHSTQLQIARRSLKVFKGKGSD